MNRQWTSCSSGSRRAGLTLIEVVAAIVILGTILVAVVLAKARHTHQLALAQRKVAAARAVDEMISAWWAHREIPTEDSGAVPDDASLTWRTSVVDNEPIEQLGGRVIRVEVRPYDDHDPVADEEPLIVVELVETSPQVEERRRKRAADEAAKTESADPTKTETDQSEDGEENGDSPLKRFLEQRTQTQ